MRLRKKSKEKEILNFTTNLPIWIERHFAKEMIGEEFKYLYKNPAIIANMEKAAVVSDIEWFKKIVASSNSF